MNDRAYAFETDQAAFTARDGRLDWAEWNQAALVAELASLRARLASGQQNADAPGAPPHAGDNGAPHSAIDMLSARFGLSRFERALLLLCAGVELDDALASWCAEATGRPHYQAVNFSLALGALAEPHWSALAPAQPLRRYHLLRVEAGQGVTHAPLSIDERVLHYLVGVNTLDERLDGLLQRVPSPACMAAEHRRRAAEMLLCARRAAQPAPVFNLFGADRAGQADVAARVAHRAGLALYTLRHEDTPEPGPALDKFVRLWSREARLLPAALLLQWDDHTPAPAARHLAERLPGMVMIASRAPCRLHRDTERFEVNAPVASSQRRLWENAFGARAASARGLLDELAARFRLSAGQIASIGASGGPASEAANPPASFHRSPGTPCSDDSAVVHRTPLWTACRAASRPALDGLAERIDARACWDDLILPELQKDLLRQLAAQSRHGLTVYDRWGFAAASRRGLGLSALFSGPSGTGKTLAAEVLATELALDLYRVDLSSVVSKYIGETEKNLRRVFDAAQGGGVILLFDEADALFGKRSEVKDSHDRYANIEVSYLLARMESFEGLAILTTNLRTSLDRAFARRLRFMIDFPFPDARHREAIWSRAFPAATPTCELQPERLAMLNVAGGNIRNIALNAAFLAADDGGPVRMSHVLRATRMEAAKLERPLSEAEIRGWL